MFGFKIHEELQPRLFTSARDVDDFSAAYPNEAIELYGVLRKHDKTVARALVHSSNLELESVKRQVLGVLLKVWSDAGSKPSEVF